MFKILVKPKKSKIRQLNDIGQSCWLDSISRSMITSSRLKDMIEQGLSGITSNPTIFEKAITTGTDYDEKIKELAQAGKTTFEIYDELTIRDIQQAADLFKPIYEKTNGMDGYVSLEINPKLADKASDTIEEGRRLHKKVARQNVLFKVPATFAGFTAIEELLSEGININVTLIFSLHQYENTVTAYLNGIKRFLEKGGDISRVHSVASVFVSRVDTAIDKLIDEKIEKETTEHKKRKLHYLRGRAAVANSKTIYRRFREKFVGDEFRDLKIMGAGMQRLLWGSTGAKDQAYLDVKYVNELIGRDTINTMPEKTFNAFLEHGIVKENITRNLALAETVLTDLKEFGIFMREIHAGLLADGLEAFVKSFDSLLICIKEKADKLIAK